MTQNDTRKGRAIEALAHGLTIVDASERSGVSRATVYRWLDDDEFKNAVLERQREVLEQVSKRMSSLALQGLDTLAELMESDDENIQLRASSAVLNRFTEVLELLRLEDRLEVLESKVLAENATR